MARVLKYPAFCFYCKKYCDPKKEKEQLKKKEIKHLSFLQLMCGVWYAHCGDCYERKKLNEKMQLS